VIAVLVQVGIHIVVLVMVVTKTSATVTKTENIVVSEILSHVIFSHLRQQKHLEASQFIS
jgi:hypothetical protein